MCGRLASGSGRIGNADNVSVETQFMHRQAVSITQPGPATYQQERLPLGTPGKLHTLFLCLAVMSAVMSFLVPLEREVKLGVAFLRYRKDFGAMTGLNDVSKYPWKHPEISR